MLLTTILNQCYRFKGFVYGQARFVRHLGRQSIEVGVRPRTGSRAMCSGCGVCCAGYDHLPERRFEFIPLWGFPVFLVYARRRVDCPECGIVAEKIPWAEGKHHLTKAYMLLLSRWARKLSWREVSTAFHTSWEQVYHAVEWVVQWGLEHRSLEGITAIGVDEIQYSKGHNYLTLVYQIDVGRVRLLWTGRERTMKTFRQFFDLLGKERSSRIEFVCSDMWKPYLRVIRERCSQALHILDRFHIVAKMNDALNEVRAEEARRMKQEGYEPVLKKTRWLLLKRKSNLKQPEKGRLRDLLNYNLRTVRAYLLKEDFQQFWEYTSPTWAGKFLDQWCQQTIYSKIEPMKKVARTLRSHRELIVNWFKAKKRISSGIVEGLNNKAKLTMRKSYGFRSPEILEMASYHALGKLPEPELAHEFY
jgi:transposase